MSGYITFLTVIAVLISIEILLRLAGSSLIILVSLAKALMSYANTKPKEFAGKTIATFFSILLVVLGWCIVFKLPGAIERYASFTNILFITLFCLGSVFILGSFIWQKISDINNPNNPNPIPNFADPEGANSRWWAYLLYYMPIWFFKNDIGPNVLKIIIGLSIFFALIIGLIMLLVKYPALSKGIFVFLQISLTIGVLAMLYHLIESNPELKKIITDSFIFRFLYNIIFALPCLFYVLVTKIYTEIKNTPKYVFMIFAVESVLILTYIATLYSKKLYEYIFDTFLLTKADLSLAKQDALNDLLKKLSEKQAQLDNLTKQDSLFDNTYNYLKDIFERITIPKDERKPKSNSEKAPIDLDEIVWDDIIQNKLYLKKNENKLRNLLTTLGFKSKSSSNFNPQKDKDIEIAVSYIQANGKNIVKLREEIQDLENAIKEITEEDDTTTANKILTGDGIYGIEDTKILLNKPQYLDKKLNIGTFDNLKTSSSLYNYQYGISLWIYLHEKPTNFRLSSTQFTPILDYAGNPKISFNLEKHMFRITIKKRKNKPDLRGDFEEKVIYETNRLPMQRWNNLVINFSGGTLDIYINGMLVSTDNEIIPYMKHDTIYSGNKNGVSGGICNITYFSAPLSKRKIEFIYNNLKEKNPPII